MLATDSYSKSCYFQERTLKEDVNDEIMDAAYQEEAELLADAQFYKNNAPMYVDADPNCRVAPPSQSLDSVENEEFGVKWTALSEIVSDETGYSSGFSPSSEEQSISNSSMDSSSHLDSSLLSSDETMAGDEEVTQYFTPDKLDITPPPTKLPIEYCAEPGLEEYKDDITGYLQLLDVCHTETVNTHSAKYRASRGQILKVDNNTREVVVDWLIQVQVFCKFELESLMLGVAMMDVFYRFDCTSMCDIQLVAITCIVIATKYLEEKSVEICQLINLTEDSYTKRQVLEMERRLLRFFQHRIHFATPHDFRHFYSHSPKTVMLTTSYLVELVMPDELYTRVPASELVTSCHILSQLLHTPNINSIHSYIHSRQCGELWETVSRIIDKLANAPHANKKGAFEKYSLEQFDSISKHPAVLNPNVAKLAEL